MRGLPNSRRRFRFTKSICVALCIAISWCSTLAIADDEPAAARSKLYAAYSQQLNELANECDSRALKTQAALTRNWLPKRDLAMTYVFVLPETSAAPPKLVETAAGQGWWQKFGELRRAQSEKLLNLADAALKAKQRALAIELTREAVRENPDNLKARKILGFVQRGSRWVTPEAAKRLDAGQVWSEQFGWISAEQLPRYENGERFYRGRWISQTDDARLHSNIRSGWDVQSDHYEVTTNLGLEEGVQLTKRLEMLYDVWGQTFVTFYATPKEIEGWFTAAADADGSSSSNEKAAKPASGVVATHQPRKPHQVTYFRDKQQYIEALEPAQPKIAASLGFYSNSAKTAFFFPSEDEYKGTLYHEATHQLFREMRSGAAESGRRNNFWIVEGIACYMESLVEHPLVEGETYGTYITLGGDNEGRLPAARKRMLDDHFYIPLHELIAFGMQPLQYDPRVQTIYSQSAGLATFLMQADGGKYRGALGDYLIAVYSDRAGPDTLEKLTGVKLEELDRQYHDFLK
jgi:hypothetical protein